MIKDGLILDVFYHWHTADTRKRTMKERKYKNKPKCILCLILFFSFHFKPVTVIIVYASCTLSFIHSHPNG